MYYLTQEDAKASSKAKYRYKATMNLTRGGHCSLGIFRTAEEAALAFDRHVLARRTLAKKIVEEFRIRRAVKVRKAAFKETRRALEVDNVTPEVAAKRAHAAAMHAFKKVKTDTYLSTSEKVQRPELNADGASEFYDADEDDEEELAAIDDEGIAAARANLEELAKVSTAMIAGGNPFDALEMCLDLVKEEEDTFTAESEPLFADGGSLAAKIDELTAEQKTLTDSLKARGNEIARLIKLEESMMPLLREEYYCSQKLLTSFLHKQSQGRAKYVGCVHECMCRCLPQEWLSAY